MNKKIISTATFIGMLGIILGAFGSHSLKKLLTVEQLSIFETGVKYQMYHALFLLFVGSNSQLSDKIKQNIFYLILSGVILFSGSIFLLATKSLTNINFSAIGILTPIGGLFLISGWFLLFYKFLFIKS